MAEAFDGKPPALTGYAEQIQRNVGFVRSARTHMATEGADTSEMEGLLSGIADGYKPLVGWITGLLDQIATGLEKTDGALRDTADEYKGVDKANSAKLDDAYKPTPGSTKEEGPKQPGSPTGAPVAS